MDVEWDPAKAVINLRRHGVDFIDAAGLFAGFVLTALDARTDSGEERWIATGLVGTQELVVAYTVRGSAYRLISARRAKRYEREAYWQARQRAQND